jgi:MoxR-like ATPase
VTQLAASVAHQAAQVGLTYSSISKWDHVNETLAQGLGVDRDRVYTTGMKNHSTYSKQKGNRFNQIKDNARDGIGVIVLGYDPGQETDIDGLVGDWRGSAGAEALLVFTPHTASAMQLRRIYAASDTTIPWQTALGLRPVMQAPVKSGGLGSTGSKSATTTPLAIDTRVWKLVRLAVRNANGVLLVGPPGTGKTTLLRRVLHEVAQDPNAWKLTGKQPDPLLVTPDESWTTQDLVGGPTLVNSSLQFEAGHLLHAIGDGRWLALDEINRADMDRIFGPIFSWLSGSTVEVGRTQQGPDGKPITLAWGDTPESFGDLDALHGAEPVEFAAGSDWRIIGTYNATDANRVFRIGQALGRRFVRVPIPPPTAALLRAHFEAVYPNADETALDVVVALYAGHLASPIPLGPAAFVRLTELLDDQGLLDGDPRDEPDALADAYVLAAAAWLARLTPELLAALRADGEAHLQTALADPTATLLGDSQWTWLQDMSQHVA